MDCQMQWIVKYAHRSSQNFRLKSLKKIRKFEVLKDT